ncbi:MAG TPA: amidohydrolase [Synergistaceae bacterium]|nr:amidohydrolase [Synergistaceae bacterium]HPJ26001.1 amidohydrolase [Synergistaceae bacterium]HPQ37309.1 amidohydrolase [Synergistaceae bacterium]
MKPRDLIFINGKVRRNFFSSPVEAIRIHKGRVSCLGSNSEVLADRGNSEILDLKGKTVLPGLIDSHNHMMTYGFLKRRFNCGVLREKGLGFFEKQLVDYVFSSEENSWVVGYNFDESLLPSFPDKSFLDSIVSSKPVFLVRSCTHSALLNSKALEMLSLDSYSLDPRDGKIGRLETGEPNGWLYEKALEKALAQVHSIDPQGVARALETAQEDYLALGLTGVHDPGTDMLSEKHYVDCYVDFERRGKLKIKTYLMFRLPSNLPTCTSLYEFKHLREREARQNSKLLLGGVKLFADGSIGSRTAALFRPYEGHASNYGVLKDMKELKKRMEKIHAARLQISIHAIGDRAVEEVLRCFEEILAKDPLQNHRHRLEHCEMCEISTMKRMQRLGLLVTAQPCFIHDFGDNYIRGLGEERANRLIACRNFVEAGLSCAMGTDAPISSPSPWQNVWAALSRKTEEGKPLGADQGIPLAQALHAYTREAAFAGFSEEECGSLDPGKSGDMTILEEDPFRMSLEDLREIQTTGTVISGKILVAKNM